MLADARKEEIQTAYRAWLESRGFKPRSGQRQMIADVARAVADDENRLCVVEAGTGTGKTAAYCLAAIPVAKAAQKKVVIATATVALQEQVLNKDLPDLKTNAKLDFEFTLAKGRRRYVCLKRLDDQLSFDKKAELSLFEEPSDTELEVYEALMRSFADNTWDGELDSWDEGIDSRLWSNVTTDHRGCANNRCGYFKQCPFFKARNALDTADVIVANHDLVLADLNLGGGVVLPEPEETVFVLDEAHHLPEKTQQHFTYTARIRATQQWLDQLNSSIGTMTQRFRRPDELLAATKKLAADTEVIAGLLNEVEGLVDSLTFAPYTDEQETSRFELGRVPASITEMCEPLSVYFRTLEDTLDTLHHQVQEVLDGDRSWQNAHEAEDWLPVVGQLVNRAREVHALFVDYANANSDGPLCARWVSRHQFDVGTDLELVSAPLDPGAILKRVLWERSHAAVCTSATLCAMGSFERFLERAGLDGDIPKRRIPSPFDFRTIATLYVPQMSTDPRNAAAHTEEIGEMLPKLLETEPSALVLFTSWRQMNGVLEALPKRIIDRCQVQGERSKQRLLDTHRQTVDAKAPSYLLGLASFAEGVDLPDDYCRHVIITKLPFSVPDDPLDQAFGEWLESEGRNPFYEVSVPDAALRLVQSCGRLIRHEKDHGRITLLDRRIVTARYGRAMLESLPPYKLEVE